MFQRLPKRDVESAATNMFEKWTSRVVGEREAKNERVDSTEPTVTN